MQKSLIENTHNILGRPCSAVSSLFTYYNYIIDLQDRPLSLTAQFHNEALYVLYSWDQYGEIIARNDATPARDE